MPPKRRGDEDYVQCRCCWLWIDLNRLERNLKDWRTAIAYSVHIPRRYRRDDELLLLPDDPVSFYLDGTYPTHSDQRPDPLGFSQIVGPGKLAYDGVEISEADIAFALTWDRGKNCQTRKPRRRPPRLTDDEWFGNEIARGVYVGLRAPISKLRDITLIIGGKTSATFSIDVQSNIQHATRRIERKGD